jgi:hypothetical protein
MEELNGTDVQHNRNKYWGRFPEQFCYFLYFLCNGCKNIWIIIQCMQKNSYYCIVIGNVADDINKKFYV